MQVKEREREVSALLKCVLWGLAAGLGLHPSWVVELEVGLLLRKRDNEAGEFATT